MNRPDWRDPSMPVIRKAKMSDGTTQVCEVPPEMEQSFAKNRLEKLSAPHYTIDPTYNLRRTDVKLAKTKTRL